MKRWNLPSAMAIAVLLFLCRAVTPAMALDFDQGVRARLISVMRTVQYQPATSDAWERAVAFQYLFLRDSVRTETQSRAAVLFFDETHVRLGPNARLTVEGRPEDGVATVTVVETSVHLFNEATSITKDAGEEGFALPGEAPSKRVVGIQQPESPRCRGAFSAA